MDSSQPKKNFAYIATQLSKKTYAQLSLLLCLFVAGASAWMLHTRYSDYRYYQYQVSFESTKAVGPRITEFVKETNRLVQLYVRKHESALAQIIDDPDNSENREALVNDMKLYFPKMLTFTLADEHGEPIWEDFDGLIGDLCRSEIQAFARGETLKPRIHPIFNGYHFDVMVPFTYNGRKNIVFVSYLANVLGEIIKTATNPDHELMLVAPAYNDLIEVVEGGARDIVIDRNDYRLNQEEIARIQIREAVAETQWDIVDLIAVGVFERYKSRLIVEALAISSLFFITIFTLVFHLWKVDQKRKQAESQELLAQQQKDTMLAMITHEFRTPLTAIHGAIDLLEFTLDGDFERSKELQQIAARNTMRLQTLVNDFLDLKQLETTGFSMTFSLENLCDLVSEAVSANSTYADKFNVTLRFDKSPAPLWIMADATRISQVIGNLLSNAIKYGGENNTVEVKVFKTANEMARVEIIDHGDGIPVEMQQNLFKTFSILKQGKNQQKVKSSGLGLSIVKGIIEKHHGNIDLHSIPGQGTMFFFEIPTAKARPLSHSTEENSTKYGAGTKSA